MEQPAYFSEARKSFHAALLHSILCIDATGVPSNADKGSKISTNIAIGIARRIGVEAIGARLAGQILFCLLSLQQQVSRFDKRDGDTLCTEIMRLIQDVDTRWSHSPFWLLPQGYLCRTFDGYPTLQKYMATIHFEPRVRQGEKQYWADYIPWICLEEQGGAYTPQVALDELINRIKCKNEHYGSFGESDVRLIIYYNQAVLYNTPFMGIMSGNVYRTFEDVAILAAKYLEEIVIPFKRVYLLNAPGREIFEIYPKLGRCD